MFIATANPKVLAPLEGNVASVDNVPLLTELAQLMLGPVTYKDFVPTGLRP
jgi:hypothetical protein